MSAPLAMHPVNYNTQQQRHGNSSSLNTSTGWTVDICCLLQSTACWILIYQFIGLWDGLVVSIYLVLCCTLQLFIIMQRVSTTKKHILTMHTFGTYFSSEPFIIEFVQCAGIFYLYKSWYIFGYLHKSTLSNI